MLYDRSLTRNEPQYQEKYKINIMKQKVAFITGGTAGIGRRTALMLADKGYSIAIAGRNEESGNQLVGQIRSYGGEAAYFRTDVSLENEVIASVTSAINRYGHIDYLFNNAGIEGLLGPLESNSEEIIDSVLSVNIKGILLFIKHVLPIMRKQKNGVIVNTASFVGTTLPLPVAVVYGASKSAVVSITQSVAASCEVDNIKVFAVCPWVTDTSMADRLTGYDQNAKVAFGASINPSGAIVPVDEIATAVFRLFEGKASLANGDAILVDKNGILNRINKMEVGDRISFKE